MSHYSLFASTPKALESLLVDELTALGAKSIKATVAGVAFSGNLDVVYKTCLWSRIASRVYLVLHRFQVNNQDDLYRGVQAIDWFLHMTPNNSLAVSFTAKHSRVFDNTHYAALRAKDAIVDQCRARFQTRPNIDTERPDIRVHVHIQGEQGEVSLDLSGASLHQRGYRDITLAAPIKENLAAALLLRSGWPKIAANGGTLLDPMCGSGTLLLEAAMIAADYAPGLLRDYFGFLAWKQHNPAQWRAIRDAAEQRKQLGLTRLPIIVGFDQDKTAINACHRHIANAGLQAYIHVERRALTDAKPALSWSPGLIMCNPPYGERLGNPETAAELYKSIGEVLKERFLNWQASFIISDPELGFRLGIRSQKPVTFYNGALECKLLRLSILEANFFVPKAKSEQERIQQIETASEQVVSDTGIEMFVNRVKKNLTKLEKWAKQHEITCYRVYDADLPEYCVAIDLYQGEQTWLNVQEYEPPKTIDARKADQRLASIMAELPTLFGIAKEHVVLKIRRRQRQTEQYEKLADAKHFINIQEGGCHFLVNFTDYLDTGIFLDHRPMRLLIQRQAQGKHFLNLFAYTGTASVHAAVGGALSTTTVDMSNTYLSWAKNNMHLNVAEGQHDFIQADCLEWLAQQSSQTYSKRFDLIFLDPPTFSNSKRMQDAFDVQTHHVELIKQAVSLLTEHGVLYFSTNFRRFQLDEQHLSGLTITDISKKTVPLDFARTPKIHYCWRITRHA